MQIDEFDGLEPDGARELLRVCADVPTWVEGLVAARPFADRTALLDRANRDAMAWTRDDVDRALARHPRIGDRPTGDGAEAQASRREQAAAQQSDADVLDAIRSGNADYERRFDRVFLIRAAGRDAPEILAELRRRLGNDDESEAIEVSDQLRQIALLRLGAAIDEPAAPEGR